MHKGKKGSINRQEANNGTKRTNRSNVQQKKGDIKVGRDER